MKLHEINFDEQAVQLKKNVLEWLIKYDRRHTWLPDDHISIRNGIAQIEELELYPTVNNGEFVPPPVNFWCDRIDINNFDMSTVSLDWIKSLLHIRFYDHYSGKLHEKIDDILALNRKFGPQVTITVSDGDRFELFKIFEIQECEFRIDGEQKVFDLSYTCYRGTKRVIEIYLPKENDWAEYFCTNMDAFDLQNLLIEHGFENLA
ncbi:hypothetical protein RsoM2USA_326 [Ralstonia phage RsoM2USA]|nr:hypothetical protein RsoM2USA_326 [Ralstonia phage RsoM2USA]